MRICGSESAQRTSESVDVENTQPGQIPRDGFIHVANMARTLMYALSLDRNVVLEDVSFYSR